MRKEIILSNWLFHKGDIEIGINYNLNIYDTVHKLSPDKVLFASECCATGTTRDWNYDSGFNGRLRDKDADTNNWFLGREKTWKFLMERPYVIGCYQWIAVEHREEAVWPTICSKSGGHLICFCRKKVLFIKINLIGQMTLWCISSLIGILRDLRAMTYL